jgi:ubiquinone/menaquinone biosynthesis C-methylase UbiE
MTSLKNSFKRIIGKPKYHFLKREFNSRPFRLLDIGGGSGDSSVEVKELFPNCEYNCLDIVEPEQYRQREAGNTKRYWQKDLQLLDYSDIPDDYFDVLVLTHIIEHLTNADAVIENMIPKLKSGGTIYIEYPGLGSTRLPSMPGSLNFFDDKTHVRIYSVHELYNVLLRAGCEPEAGGIRRNWARIMLFPLLLPYKLLKRTKTIGYEFWDVCGFAEYVWARKKE